MGGSVFQTPSQARDNLKLLHYGKLVTCLLSEGSSFFMINVHKYLFSGVKQNRKSFDTEICLTLILNA